jgi:phosphoribosylanthranilate isomerase
MRVKICGITNIEDALTACEAGADALGLVFYAQSSRHIDTETAASIAAAVPPFVTLTGLFVDADSTQVERVLEQVPLNLLQFHGEESARYCDQFQRPYIKALRMKDDLHVLAAMQQYPNARGFLLDAYRPGVPGGTGESFDWQRVPRHSGRQIILAGGLTPENVAEAIQIAHPQAVDVSGGVEARPGRKDPRKVRAFIKAAKTMSSEGVKQ